MYTDYRFYYHYYIYNFYQKYFSQKNKKYICISKKYLYICHRNNKKTNNITFMRTSLVNTFFWWRLLQLQKS